MPFLSAARLRQKYCMQKPVGHVKDQFPLDLTGHFLYFSSIVHWHARVNFTNFTASIVQWGTQTTVRIRYSSTFNSKIQTQILAVDRCAELIIFGKPSTQDIGANRPFSGFRSITITMIYRDSAWTNHRRTLLSLGPPHFISHRNIFPHFCHPYDRYCRQHRSSHRPGCRSSGSSCLRWHPQCN